MFSKTLPETRSAFLLQRLALTALLLLILLGLVYVDWYPDLLLQISGIGKQLVVVVAAALVIGPGLSTLLYRPGKRRLLLDLIVVLVIEVAVIATVAIDLYQRRPYFAVFAVDRFELVTAGEVDRGDIRYDELRNKPFGGPRLVYAKLPVDPEARSNLVVDVVLGGAPDIDRRPEFWLPYSEGIADVTDRLVPLEEASNGALLIDAWLRSQALDGTNFGYLPLTGPADDAAIVIDRSSGMPVTMLDFDPW